MPDTNDYKPRFSKLFRYGFALPLAISSASLGILGLYKDTNKDRDLSGLLTQYNINSTMVISAAKEVDDIPNYWAMALGASISGAMTGLLTLKKPLRQPL